MIESISTEIFKEFSKSDKVVFDPSEFETLNAKYGKLNALKDKLAEKQALENQLASYEARKDSLLAQLTDIGELPVEQPVELAERYGWVQLKKQKEDVDTQLVSVSASIDSTIAALATINTEITSLKTGMEVM